MGTDKSIFNALSMWQRQDAWSSYKYEILKKNDFSEECFTKRDVADLTAINMNI